jgi:hypothetical protein
VRRHLGVLIVNAGLPVPGGCDRRGALRRLIGSSTASTSRVSAAALHRDAGDDAGRAGPCAGHLRSAPIYFTDSPSYSKISTGELIPGLDLPNAVLILAVIAVLAAVLLNRTVLGRYTYSIGSNEEATALSGINVRRWKISSTPWPGCSPGSPACSSRPAWARLSRRPAPATSCRPSRPSSSAAPRWSAARARSSAPSSGAHHLGPQQRPADHVDPAGVAERHPRLRDPVAVYADMARKRAA